jgi:hypothetical protein
MSDFVIRIDNVMNVRQITWSKTEKSVARRAFDLAYRRECEAITNRIRDMMSIIANPEDIWRIHDFLHEKHKKLHEKYDYRYSVLIFVFAGLMKDGWLKEADLVGLHEDKVSRIIALVNM